MRNSIGMDMLAVSGGTFMMGSDAGDWTEKPCHEVRIMQDFLMSRTVVTNRQYECFDPTHRLLRGKMGFSQGDDEACVFVSHDQAEAFCRWLSGQEGKTYRLPTEAEWEYACRAGTETAYACGDTLPEGFGVRQDDDHRLSACSLTVGQGIENAWGLQDMHGLVEEWCGDWFAPYAAKRQDNPGGPAQGDFRVTRGGCVQTSLKYLRSAQRMAMPPWVQSPVIGFRVVCTDMTPQLFQVTKKEQHLPPAGELHAEEAPVFLPPQVYVLPPKNERVPFYAHNHVPSLCALDNGDLLAIWFSTQKEHGREMVILSSRFSQREQRWSEAELFFKVPGRNMSCSSLLKKPGGRLYHFCGIGVGSSEETLYLAMRYSDDDGRTFSEVLPIESDITSHKPINQPTFGPDGSILVSCDHYTVTGDDAGMGSVLYRGDPETLAFQQTTCYGLHAENYLSKNGKAGWIAGVHGIVEPLADGRILAVGRSDCMFKGHSIDGKMPLSISDDGGRTWSYRASPFPPIGLCQRHALMRLREGALMLCSFTDQPQVHQAGKAVGMDMPDAHGHVLHGYGLFAALSFDEGETWPVVRLITPCREAEVWDVGASRPPVTLDKTHAQPWGYMQAVQTQDGMIHLISSRHHYRFNAAWLLSPAEK